MSEHGPRVAVVLAGGAGNRAGLEYPKQFAKIAGKQILEHTLDIFQSHRQIDEIVVVSKPDHTQNVLEIVNRNRYSKVSKVINGGATRTESTRAAIIALSDHPEGTDVLFHDAVRPFLSHSIIDRCLSALERALAVDVVVRSADTLVAVDAKGYISSIPDRAAIRRGQTPQAFKLGVIREAYSRYSEPEMGPATCDCSVVFKAMPHVRISTVDGDPANIKVTEPIDLFLADKLFQSRGDSTLVDDHKAAVKRLLGGTVLVVFGGSSGIGSSIVEAARSHGAIVFSFSRNSTGTNVADPDSVASALEKADLEAGRIDYIVNTAGELVRRPIMDMTDDEITRSIAANVRGAINVARGGHPYLARSRGGLLLFTSSSYTRGRAFTSVYSASKAAVANMAQALAEEWEDAGIKVNCMNPERTATPMRARNFGHEAPETLLASETVADASLAVLVSGRSGHIVDVRLGDRREWPIRVGADAVPSSSA